MPRIPQPPGTLVTPGSNPGSSHDAAQCVACQAVPCFLCIDGSSPSCRASCSLCSLFCCSAFLFHLVLICNTPTCTVFLRRGFCYACLICLVTHVGSSCYVVCYNRGLSWFACNFVCSIFLHYTWLVESLFSACLFLTELLACLLYLASLLYLVTHVGSSCFADALLLAMSCTLGVGAWSRAEALRSLFDALLLQCRVYSVVTWWQAEALRSACSSQCTGLWQCRVCTFLCSWCCWSASAM